MASELYLMEMGDGRFSILLCGDRTKTQMPAMTPAESLIAFLNWTIPTIAKWCVGYGTSILCSRNGSIFL